MTADDLTTQITQSLEADGNQVTTVQLDCGQAIVGYQSKFSLAWMATKLHLFTVVVQSDKANEKLLQQVTDQAVEYANQTKGTFRGLQVGLAVIPTIVAKSATDGALSQAQQRPPKMFAQMSFPVIVLRDSGQLYTYTGSITVGAIYAGWIRERLRAVLEGLVKPKA